MYMERGLVIQGINSWVWRFAMLYWCVGKYGYRCGHFHEHSHKRYIIPPYGAALESYLRQA